MLPMVTRSTTDIHRYVALGDSFTEGVGDHDPRLPNGVRGWADRVAEVLATKQPDFTYANLAVRVARWTRSSPSKSSRPSRSSQTW
jgi:lysophospholipase L1-like esterase